MNRAGRAATLLLVVAAAASFFGCAASAPPQASPPLLPTLSQPVTSTVLAAAIKRGLSEEVTYLREDWSSPASSTALGRAQSGAPLAIRMVDSRKVSTALHESADSTLVAYMVPVTIDGVPVGQFDIGVSGNRLTDGSYSSGPEPYTWYAAGAQSLVASLGPDVQIFCTPPPAAAVIGWSQRGEGVVFVSIIDGAYAEGELLQPQIGQLYTGEQALRYVSKFWVRR